MTTIHEQRLLLAIGRALAGHLQDHQQRNYLALSTPVDSVDYGEDIAALKEALAPFESIHPAPVAEEHAHDTP